MQAPGERRQAWSQPALDSEARTPGKMSYCYHSVMADPGVAINFLIRYDSCCTDGFHAWIYKSGQKPMTTKVISPKGKSTILFPCLFVLNDHVNHLLNLIPQICVALNFGHESHTYSLNPDIDAGRAPAPTPLGRAGAGS